MNAVRTLQLRSYFIMNPTFYHGVFISEIYCLLELKRLKLMYHNLRELIQISTYFLFNVIEKRINNNLLFFVSLSTALLMSVFVFAV